MGAELKMKGSTMRLTVGVVAMLFSLGAGAAYAQEFKNEASPLFDNCGDPSYEKAKTDGITVGISPSPPFTSLNPDTQKAEGLVIATKKAFSAVFLSLPIRCRLLRKALRAWLLNQTVATAISGATARLISP